MNTPEPDCPLCPRLCDFRHQNRVKFPAYFNGAVPPFVSTAPRLLVVGLAPGLHGANNTGRPFTADYAGDLLYPTLITFGFARGDYAERANDGLKLVGARITNAVRCVPPENKPTSEEIKNCLPFLESEIRDLQKDLRVIVALGSVAHQSVLRALGIKIHAMKFGHGTEYELEIRHPRESGDPVTISNQMDSRLRGNDGVSQVTLLSSYHCSRYNTNTGRLTVPMFHAVFARARELCLEFYPPP